MRIVLQELLLSGFVLHLRISRKANPHVCLLKQIGHVVFDVNQSIGGHEHAIVLLFFDGFRMKELDLADLIKERVN